MLKYKGYTGIVHFDADAMLFHGEIVGLNDVVTFRGMTPEEIKKEFEVSIDGYIDWCKELGQEPEKPFSGDIHLRVQPDFHATLASEAKSKGISLNNYIHQMLKRAVESSMTVNRFSASQEGIPSEVRHKPKPTARRNKKTAK